MLCILSLFFGFVLFMDLKNNYFSFISNNVLFPMGELSNIVIVDLFKRI